MVLLAGAVAGGPPTAADAAAERRLFGRLTGLASILTLSGYHRGVLTVFALAAIATGIWFDGGRLPFLIALAAAQALSQFACDLLKARYGRKRPENWLYRQEINAAYPSGHAATGVVVYGGLALFVLFNAPDGALRTVLASALALWGLGIGWSRIALGAHYLSDVIAGLLVGTGTLALVLAFTRIAFVPG